MNRRAILGALRKAMGRGAKEVAISGGSGGVAGAGTYAVRRAQGDSQEEALQKAGATAAVVGLGVGAGRAMRRPRSAPPRTGNANPISVVDREFTPVQVRPNSTNKYAASDEIAEQIDTLTRKIEYLKAEGGPVGTGPTRNLNRMIAERQRLLREAERLHRSGQ